MPFPLKMSFPYSVVLIVIPRARNSGGSGWIPVISPHELITEHLTLPAEPSCSRGTHMLCISHRGRASKPATPVCPAQALAPSPSLLGEQPVPGHPLLINRVAACNAIVGGQSTTSVSASILYVKCQLRYTQFMGKTTHKNIQNTATISS